MIQKAKFLIFCMIFVVGGVFGQKINYTVLKTDTIYYRKGCYNMQKFLKYYKPKTCDSSQKNKVIPQVIYTSSFSAIPQNYYTQNLGFFCKKELQLEKAIKFPLKFRLGSVEQCDWLEGK